MFMTWLGAFDDSKRWPKRHRYHHHSILAHTHTHIHASVGVFHGRGCTKRQSGSERRRRREWGGGWMCDTKHVFYGHWVWQASIPIYSFRRLQFARPTLTQLTQREKKTTKSRILWLSLAPHHFCLLKWKMILRSNLSLANVSIYWCKLVSVWYGTPAFFHTENGFSFSLVRFPSFAASYFRLLSLNLFSISKERKSERKKKFDRFSDSAFDGMNE